MRLRHCIIISYSLLSLLIVPVSAQTGAGLVLQPWPEGVPGQVSDQYLAFNRGHTDNADARFSLQRYDIWGRWRQDKDDSNTLVFGFDGNHLDIATSDPVLPKRLIDQSLAAGFRLNDDGQDSVWLVLGVGYAGSNPYTDGDAVYGQANLIYTHPIDEKSSWRIVLNYDGNRTIFPDIPIPAIAYQRRSSETLTYAVGIPTSTIYWRPKERWLVSVVYVLPVTLNASIEYTVDDGMLLFARFENHLDAFTVNGAPDHQRLFLQQRRLEMGARFHLSHQLDVTVAAGYAFGQEFSTGFDVRDLNDVADLSDEPYLGVSTRIRF